MTSVSSGKVLLAVLLFVLSAVSAAALQVNPSTQQLNQPKEESYSYVYTVVNTDPQPRSLKLVLDPWSEYLKDRVTLSKQQFALLPGASENVQLTFNPAGLGPETHTLKVGVYEDDQLLTSFSLLITVLGDPVERYAVAVDARDTSTEDAVPVSVTLENYGNIIGYAQLTLTITKGGSYVGSVHYPTTYQVLPNTKSTYDLVYTDALEPGFYEATVQSTYALHLVNATDQFSVRLGTQTERINTNEDLILTFASLGNPQAVRYSLVDERGVERVAGTAVPKTGDIVVKTNDLPAGTYDLTLAIQSVEQHITVIIRDRSALIRQVLVGVTIVILLGGLYTSRRLLTHYWRIYQLRRAVAVREAEVTKLINRAHRLVDRYSTLHARRHQATGISGSSGQGSR